MKKERLSSCLGRMALCSLLSWPFLSQHTQAASLYETALAKAMDSMYAIDYDRAATEFEAAIRLDPGNPRAYLYLATNYWMKTLYSQNTLVSTAFGLPLDPYVAPNGNPCPADLRKKYEETVGRMKEKAQARLNANPKDPEALFWLGMAEGSESVFIISVDHKLFAAKSHADKSFELMETANALDKSFKDPLFPMGMHMHLLGTRGLLTRTILKLMGYKVSKEEGRKFVEIAVSNARYVRDDARLGLVLCDIREERWHEAITEMQTVLQKFPQDSLLAVAMGRLQAAQGDFANAVATFEKIRQRISQNHPGYQVLSPGEVNLRLALALLGTGKPLDAQKAIEQALLDKKATPLVRAASFLTLGQCLDLLQNRQGAIQAYQAALALTPRTPSHDKARQFLNEPYNGKIPPG